MERVFISDLHLEQPDSERFLRFAELLQAESASVDELYILGDLVEMWVGDDDDSELAVTLQAALKQASTCCEVFLLHGNRDFLFGDVFAAACGVTLINEPYVLDGNLLLMHGDALCTDDVEYQTQRAFYLRPETQAGLLAQPLAARKLLGQQLRAKSRSENASKATNIMDVNDDAVLEALHANAATTLLHGHTHRPGQHQHDQCTRVVLGDWERCGWLCRQTDGRLQLECFSLARHYENERSHPGS
ncbi:MAG: UDP-2,3-diacylglucosamine diphosphatase [Pseudomonadota bacterium]